jgi:hypothetical protein
MLGDHYPVSVTFQTGNRKGTGINEIENSKSSNSTRFGISGQRVDGEARGIVIERSGENTHKRIIK